MKKIFAIFTAFVMILGLASCQSQNKHESNQKDVITLSINTIQGNYRDELVEYIAENVEKNTDGRIIVKVLPAGSMGDERELVESVQMGSIDMVLTADALIASVISELGWINLPGIVSDYEEADKVFFGNGWICEKVSEICDKNGIVKLGAFDNGFRTVGSTKAIKEPDDLKGVKIRCGSSNTTMYFYEKLGCLPVSISSSEILTSLESGAINATDNSITNFVANGLQDNLSSVSLLNYSYSAGSVIANKDKWTTISSQDQQVIMDIVRMACEQQVKDNRAYSDEIIKKYTSEKRWQVYENSDEMQKAIDSAALDTAKKFFDQYDKGAMEKIVDALNKKVN